MKILMKQFFLIYLFIYDLLDNNDAFDFVFPAHFSADGLHDQYSQYGVLWSHGEN